MIMLSDIARILKCDIFNCHDQLNVLIDCGCASDLMSDVLAFSQSGALLLTGLVNNQTIQTAYIAEIKAIVFVRGKKPDSTILTMANEKKIPLLGTPYSMYEACGILYNNGLVSTMKCISDSAVHG